MVTDGNCARWLITSGDLVIWIVGDARRAAPGRCCSVWLGRYRLPSDCTVGQRFGLGDEDHAVLVGLLEDGRDDALAERVVERVVDRWPRVMP